MAGPELLVLAKHAAPAVDPDLPAAQWPLSEAGRGGAERLAERLRPLAIDLVASSVERKAAETASAVARVLDVTFQTAHDLHEHERPYEPDRSRFEQNMARFFEDPSAHRPVERRFTTALDALVRAHRSLRLVVVAHGTVLSLHLAARYGLDAASTWSSLGMPSYVVVELRTKTVVDVVREV
ncbi:MAG TPA: histidine phosphatase family protein [Acidimicrobiales bacterium]|nr:histidine phosphatase family protein [Acidimicrobiales bacterium]